MAERGYVDQVVNLMKSGVISLIMPETLTTHGRCFPISTVKKTTLFGIGIVSTYNSNIPKNQYFHVLHYIIIDKSHYFNDSNTILTLF